MSNARLSNTFPNALGFFSMAHRPTWLRIKAWAYAFNARAKQTEQIYMVFVAVLIGVLTGVVAVGFRLALQAVGHLFWGGDVTSVVTSAVPWFRALLTPALGVLFAGYVIWKLASEAKGHGVPEVMAAVATEGGRMRARVPLVKTIASALTIGSGGAAGSEGPIIQVGAGVGSIIGQFLRVGERRLRAFVGCGAAAGVAAIFNAPVAGALFATEIVLGDFGVPQFSPIVVSSVVATVISRQVFGAEPVFHVAPYQLASPWELLAYVVLGVLAGLVGILFIRSMDLTEDLSDRIPLPQPVVTALGALAVGAIGIFLPEVFGVGYDTIERALHLGADVPTGVTLGVLALAALMGAKLVSVCLTIGFGGSGGIFAPSLYLGATLGGAVGAITAYVFPQLTVPAGAYALVGMGAVLGAVTHAPITAIVIIFELTNDYRIILPPIIPTIIGTSISLAIQKESMYTVKLVRKGVDVHRGKDVNILRSVPVAEVMRTDMLVARPGDLLSEVLQKAVAHHADAAYVIDERDRFHGVLTVRELHPLLVGRSPLDVIVAEDVANAHFPSVKATAGLDRVMRELGGGIREEVPVVEGDRLVGVIRLHDVIRRYNRELFRRNMAAHIARNLDDPDPSEPVAQVAGYQVVDVPVPGDMVGKTVAEADVRRNYGVTVLLIKENGKGTTSPDGAAKRPSGRVFPASPTARFERGQRIVVFGEQEAVGRFRRL